MQQPGKAPGVTLFEMLIVLAVIAVLAGIAYPSYRDYTDRAKRSEAVAKLLEIAASQERYYLNANRYGSLVELGYTAPLVTSSGAYTVTISRNDVEGYSITAEYNHSGREHERCSSFTIDEVGKKSSTGSLDSCWAN